MLYRYHRVVQKLNVQILLSAVSVLVTAAAFAVYSLKEWTSVFIIPAIVDALLQLATLKIYTD